MTPELGERGYVFPVYGSVAFGDTFGAFRPDVSGDWHHGDDIFAPLGTPLVAVAHGVVFSVGWEKVGGWRLWLRDDAGNEFYYAHLSAYSPLAVNGAIVNAGDVLGFVGDTGDAEGTPYHLHFEIHPAGLLQRGYDGAVDPTTYLDAWRHLNCLRDREPPADSEGRLGGGAEGRRGPVAEDGHLRGERTRPGVDRARACALGSLAVCVSCVPASGIGSRRIPTGTTSSGGPSSSRRMRSSSATTSCCSTRSPFPTSCASARPLSS